MAEVFQAIGQRAWGRWDGASVVQGGMRKPNSEAIPLLLLYAAMAFAAAAILSQLANDPDFFWHLKTGEWIWQHRTLPAQEPFNYVNDLAGSPGHAFTLTAYWLAQLVYYLVHAALGMPGIAGLRFLLALLIVLALLRLRRGDAVIHAALVLAALPLLFSVYHLDRPQVFSFLFFAVLLFLLERERSSPAAPPGWKSLLSVPLLMLLWANMHGGHALGQITIVLFMALEGVKFAHPSLGPTGWRRYRRLLAVGGAGFAASLANPNFHRALLNSLSPAPTWVWNQEYQSSFAIFRLQPLIAVFWVALALAALAILCSLRRPDITWIALLVGTGYQGFLHIRYIPFFLIAALPAISAFLSVEGIRRWARPLAVAAALGVLAFSLRYGLPTREQVARSLRVNEEVYPVGAADFILDSAPQGNLYNTYLWGGYLLWRLAPGRKVFADGRGLSPDDAFKALSINIAFASPGVPPLWSTLLNRYGVGYVIIPRVDRHQGVVFDDVPNLRAALLQAPEWVPVFADEISLVFVRNVPEHADLIRRHGLSRERLLRGWGRG